MIGVELLGLILWLNTFEDFMSTVMTVSVTIAPEARAFIDMVGQREESELMIERAKHVVPGAYGDRGGVRRGGGWDSAWGDFLDAPGRRRP